MISNIRHDIYATNGIRMHVASAGKDNAPVVLMLHGFPEFWYGWRNQIDDLVKAGFKVVMPDQRGYNLTDKPKGIGAYGIDTLTRDIAELIPQLSNDKIFLVGHDWGGIVAWYLAMQFPEKIDKLINLNIPHPFVARNHLRSNPGQIRKSWYVFFFQIPWWPEYLLSQNRFGLLKKLLISTSLPGSFSALDLQRYENAWSQKYALTAMINWYRASIRIMFDQRFSPRIDIPTLLIWGKKDIALGSEMAQPSIDLCPDGRLVSFDQATHWVQHDRSGQVNALIRDFLTK